MSGEGIRNPNGPFLEVANEYFATSSFADTEDKIDGELSIVLIGKSDSFLSS